MSKKSDKYKRFDVADYLVELDDIADYLDSPSRHRPKIPPRSRAFSE